ncbi:hypothetical protein QBC40DRAFT_343174 [Triangularia verruculosa]|uniref:SET domain-containing protein n=1 Tax=Triangularia verruculosa TaxID=2587418 RepID=A0AAN6X8B6_9PEZI|nr:hypothetical protein QBC40DRAFT_343174 [Triangularia verruculosa]
MQSTKITRSVINANTLAKAVAEMEAILAQMDPSDLEDVMTTSTTSPGEQLLPDHTIDSRAAAQELFSDPECSTSDSDPDSTALAAESENTDATTLTKCSPSANTREDGEGSGVSDDEPEAKKEKLKLGYVIFPKPILVDASKERTYQIGTFDGKPVYHYWSRAEQFLSNFEYTTPLGRRFLFDGPDSLLPPQDKTDTNHTPQSGRWWPGPGNMKKNFNFQRYFTIRPSKLGGMGAYATTDIEIGRVILVERPLLLTTHAKFLNDVQTLPPAALAIYKSLDGNHFSDWATEIKNRNCFDVGPKIGFFAIASRFNHSCGHTSNVSYSYDSTRKVMVLCAKDDIEAGTELTLDYGVGSSAALYAMYGFVCRCGACRPLTRQDLVAMGADRKECARWGLVNQRKMAW